MSRACVLAEVTATGDPSDESDWQMKLVNALIAMLTCPLRVSTSPRRSTTRTGRDRDYWGMESLAAGIDTCGAVTTRHRCRSAVGVLILTLGLAVPGWVSAASDPVSERPPSMQLRLPAAPPVFALPPLSSRDLSGLPEADEAESLIGLHRSLSDPSLGESPATNSGGWIETAVGSVWRLQIASPDAASLRVHVQEAALGAGHLWVYGESDSVFGPYTGTGPYRDGDFWSPAVTGESLTLEYRPENGMRVEEGLPFAVDTISHVWRPVASAVTVTNDPVDETQEVTPPRVKRWGKLATANGMPEANRIVLGRPTGIRLAAVQEPTLFSNGAAYQFKVAENTESVEILFSAVRPEIDVDLYSRFARNSELMDGVVVADHRSEGKTGTERIVISRNSDPPLRSGTYFISLGVSSTGARAEGTLTVMPRYHNHVCYFELACRPEWVPWASAVAMIYIERDAGHSVQCTGALLNDRSNSRTPYFLTAAHCVNSESEARSIQVYWYFQNAACNLEIPDSRRRVTHGADLLAVENGSVVGQTRFSAFGAGDIALLRLRQQPPADVAYLGWNVNHDALRVSTNVIGIHHTESLPKKISFGRVRERYPHMTDIRWATGFSLEGASGSPLINEDGEVLGVLSGGGGAEGCFDSGNNYYSNLSSFYPKIRSFLENAPSRRVDSGTRSITTVVDVGLGGGERPVGLAVDPAGGLYISGDGSNVRSIRGGSGLSVNVRNLDNGGRPGGLVHDSTFVYVADYSNHVVWRWNPVASTMRRVAGIGVEGYSGDGGPATAASMYSPWALALGVTRMLYVGEFAGGRVREIDLTTGTINTVLYGLGTASGLAIDAIGNLFVADSEYDVVWRWNKSTEEITRVAGTGQRGYFGDGGPATAAQLHTPYGMALDTSGNLYIADSGNHSIRRVDAASGIITTVAGTGVPGDSGDGGLATAAQLNTPVDVAIDWANNMYVADFGNRVVRRLSVPASESSPLDGQLVSGVPRRFELSANSARVMQNGEQSYTIIVPSRARRLTLVLATDNPRVDVDLYARYGRDNSIDQWGWRSAGPTGNERIVLGLGSDYTLWAGTYYISLLLYDNTGSSASGTLTAILE